MIKSELTRCPECWTSLSSSDDVKPCELHRVHEAPVKANEDRADPEEPEIDTSERVRVIRFPPEAADGEHWVPVEISDNLGILQCIKAWALDAEIGDRITIRVTTMTKREIERLPSI